MGRRIFVDRVAAARRGGVVNSKGAPGLDVYVVQRALFCVHETIVPGGRHVGDIFGGVVVDVKVHMVTITDKYVIS